MLARSMDTPAALQHTPPSLSACWRQTVCVNEIVHISNSNGLCHYKRHNMDAAQGNFCIKY